MIKLFSLGLVYLLSLLVLALPVVSSAQPYDITKKPCEGISDASVCDTGTSDPIMGPNGIIMKATNIISYIVGFVSIVMIILAGLKFVTSGGNSESIASARSTIIYALVGLAVVACSQLLVRFMISIL